MKRCYKCNYRARTMVNLAYSQRHSQPGSPVYVCTNQFKCEDRAKRKRNAKEQIG